MAKIKLALAVLIAVMLNGNEVAHTADIASGRFVTVQSYANNSRHVAEFADKHLAKLCSEYDFNPSCWNRFPVTISRNRPGYGEGYAVSVLSSRDGQYCEQIEISESFPLVMSHALPHELTHAWVTYTVRFPFSTWLNESLATTNEDEQLIQDGIQRALGYLKQNRLMPPLYNINLDISVDSNKRLRADMDTIAVYYSAACAFASFCYELPGGKPNYIRFCSRLSGVKTVSKEKFLSAIGDFYGFQSEEEINKAFAKWLSETEVSP